MTDTEWLEVINAVNNIEIMMKKQKSIYYDKDKINIKIINKLVFIHQIINSSPWRAIIKW